MIRLFLSDIDGCLAETYQPYDLAGLAELAGYARRAETDPRYPRLGICTGRSYNYAEAIAQVLGVRGPTLFESGAGWFDLPTAMIRWNPAYTPDIRDRLAEVRAFVQTEIVRPSPIFTMDIAKHAQVGIVGPTAGSVLQVLDQIRAFVEPQFPDLHVFSTPYSIDVVPAALTKAGAMAWVADELGLALDELAFIGDTDGDIGAIRTVGYGFAPANGTPQTRAAAHHVTQGHLLDGTLEAYRWCLVHNGAPEAVALDRM